MQARRGNELYFFEEKHSDQVSDFLPNTAVLHLYDPVTWQEQTKTKKKALSVIIPANIQTCFAVFLSQRTPYYGLRAHFSSFCVTL